MRKYTREELEDMPTLVETDAADLKVDEEDFRVYLSRVGEGIQYEVLIGGRWWDLEPITGGWILSEDQ